MITTGKRPRIGPPYVRALEAVEHLESCGGKAFNLGQMMGLGIRVPPGFVVTDAAFQEFLDDNELRAPINYLLSDLVVTQADDLRARSEAIRSRVVSATIPARILSAVYERRFEMLPAATLAVRSSAVGEDSRHAAFAGQLDSFLNVDSDRALQDALLACWASYWSQRSLFYQRSRGIHLRGMGVVIQEMVPSRISGILFTRNPESLTESSTVGRDSLVAEYCFGHGDELAAGKMNPGRFEIARSSFHWLRRANPEQSGDTDDVDLFNNDQVEKLARAGLKLEEHFGCPQDIEWTIDQDGQLYLVQSRPITVGTTAEQTPRQSSTQRTPPAQAVVWSNANVNENFPEPISPLLYSIASIGYYHYFRNLGLAVGISQSRVDAMEYPLRNIIGVHGARMYYNLSNIHAILRRAPRGDLLAEWFNNFVGTTQTPRPEPDATWKASQPNRMIRLFEVCRIALKSTRQFLFLSKRIAAFEQTIDEFSGRTSPDRLAQRSLPELLDDLRGFMLIRCHRWTNASLADAAAMMTYGMLKRLLNKEFPARDQSSLHNSMLKGLRDLVSTVPVAALWDLSRMIRADAALAALFATDDNAKILSEIRKEEGFANFRSAFDAYLNDWGFRCSGELMLTIPSFQEDPQALFEILKAYVLLEGESPLDLLHRQETERAAETARILKELKRKKLLWPSPWPTKSQLARLVLSWSHKAIALRERARLKQALLYSRLRRIALAIGHRLVPLGLLEAPKDVFYLTYQEIESLLAGSAMFPYCVQELVHLRKTGHARLSSMTPSDAFVLSEGCYLPADQSQPSSQSESSEADGQTELAGVGACGGKVTAPATILKDISECRLLTGGDILVTRQTDPGWGPVFLLIKGLVMERGGMLSHGAILAREYGIPTVVAVRDATRRISPRQTLCVDGDRGVVQLANH